MSRKIGLCFIIVIIAILAAVLFPGEKFELLKNRLLGINNNYSSLRVYSLGGDMNVYIDGEHKGIVYANESYYEVFPISVGEHEVSLAREATHEKFYKQFQRTIRFEKGFDTVVSWEIGPTEAASSGWILYAKKSSELSEKATLNILCEPSDCLIEINGEEEQSAPISQMELSLDNQHEFTTTKIGYQDLVAQILPEDSEERSRFKGYELYLYVNLYQFPLEYQ